MNAEAFASIFVDNVKAPISKEEVKNILFRNTRFIPSELIDDYQSLVFLEASEVSPDTLDARAFESICNRVSKRLLYAVKTRHQRFVNLESLEEEPRAEDRRFDISEILEQLTLEEQTHVVMKLEGRTLKEIAARLDISISTAHDHWRKLAKRLKALME